jgi:hypothetical protein
MFDKMVFIVPIIAGIIAYIIAATKTSKEGRTTDQYMSIGAFLSAGIAILVAVVFLFITITIKCLLAQ